MVDKALWLRGMHEGSIRNKKYSGSYSYCNSCAAIQRGRYRLPWGVDAVLEGRSRPEKERAPIVADESKYSRYRQTRKSIKVGEATWLNLGLVHIPDNAVGRPDPDTGNTLAHEPVIEEGTDVTHIAIKNLLDSIYRGFYTGDWRSPYTKIPPEEIIESLKEHFKGKYIFIIASDGYPYPYLRKDVVDTTYKSYGLVLDKVIGPCGWEVVYDSPKFNNRQHESELGDYLKCLVVKA